MLLQHWVFGGLDQSILQYVWILYSGLTSRDLIFLLVYMSGKKKLKNGGLLGIYMRQKACTFQGEVSMLLKKSSKIAC